MKESNKRSSQIIERFNLTFDQIDETQSYSKMLTLRLIRLFTITLPCVPTVSCVIGGRRAHLYRAYVRVEVHDWLCGGTLVAHDKVFTAAHCLFTTEQKEQKPVENEAIRIVKGDFTIKNWSKTATYFSCDQYIIHESYKKYTDLLFNPYNLAMIDLEESVDLTKPENAILPSCASKFDSSSMTRSFFNPKYGYAVGMGVTNCNADYYSDFLKAITLDHTKLCSWKFLHAIGKRIMVDENHQVCYRSQTKQDSMCVGDAGGPIVHIEDGKAVGLIGVDISGDIGCDPGLPNVFIRAEAFDEWINNQILALSLCLVFEAE